MRSCGMIFHTGSHFLQMLHTHAHQFLSLNTISPGGSVQENPGDVLMSLLRLQMADDTAKFTAQQEVYSRYLGFLVRGKPLLIPRR